MPKLSYSEKLKDVRWQKVRLEVLNRAKWTCECCGNPKRTLHVHHGYYRMGLEPWEYPISTLRCLCEPCHKDFEVEREKLLANLACFGPAPDMMGVMTLINCAFEEAVDVKDLFNILGAGDDE